MEPATTVSYFLGAISPKGFISQFSKAYDADNGWRTYIIKCGPGTGKSSIMKKCAEVSSEAGYFTQVCPCSSDPNSLDAVIIEEKKIMIADGTAPHNMDTNYPGVCENLINLGQYWDSEKLRKSRSEIMQVSRECGQLHSQASKFLAASMAFSADTLRHADNTINKKKIAEFVKRFIERELTRNSKSIKGCEKIRLLSAATPNGYTYFEDSIYLQADRVFVIEDEFGAVSKTFMSNMRNALLEAGFNIITCVSPLEPFSVTEQIIIPSQSVAIITSNKRLICTKEPYRAFHARRFTDIEALAKYRERITFNRKASRELLAEASRCMSQALAIHNILEKYYIESMDFEGCEQECEKLINIIK